ncbi:hypothetical protein [Lutimonas sp.]|jgi:uncharacterized protein (DUF302 family)|uniref:hypothetical protein n=1 Tax=Lutimonas sp. TaxID=1872403 RepID=UPI003C79402E
MKKSILITLFLLVTFISKSISAQELSPYILVGESPNSLNETEQKVTDALKASGFEILGQYNAENNQTLKVIVYSRKDLQEITLKVKDRGALAAALKVGLKADGPGTTISYLNPEYLFQAYLRDAYDSHKVGLIKVSSDVKAALSPLGNKNTGFGGSMTAEDLREYHYKMMMPYFTDPVELKEFSSFEEGVKTIENNLKSQKGATQLVYSLKFNDQKVAVFGIAFLDEEKGEKQFLPVIGEDHLAAMPYEIIIEGKKATMLHGRYRIALHWPELTMGTFMKIRSTPGDYKDAFEALCE